MHDPPYNSLRDTIIKYLNLKVFFLFLFLFPSLTYNINLNPLSVASPETEFIAPSTGSPRSSFLLRRPRTMRKAVAAMMAIKAVAQLTLIAMTVKFLEKEEVNRSIIERGGVFFLLV